MNEVIIDDRLEDTIKLKPVNKVLFVINKM